MSMDVAQKRRKPFTLKTALAFLLVLIGSAATIALPIVLVVANTTFTEQHSRVAAKEKEIRRLKAENMTAISQANDLREEYQNAIAENTVPSESPSEQVGDLEAPRDRSIGSSGFDSKLAQLHAKVTVGEMQTRPVSSEDFESRLARLYDRVVPAAESHSPR
jgi:cell division protein FtsB